MKKIKLKGVHTEIDRHGNTRLYFRKDRKSKRIRLRETPGSQAFHDEIARAQLGLSQPKEVHNRRVPEARKKIDGSFGWLVEEYLTRKGPVFADSTLTQKRRVLMGIAEETCLSASGTPLRDVNYKSIQKAHITKLRDQKVATPEAANHRVKALSALFEWACSEVELIDVNPCISVNKFKSSGDGHHTWTDDELDQFLEHHQTGSKAHLCFTILRYTGLRISDVSFLGPKHLYTDKETGVLHFKIATLKNARNTGKVIDMPVLPPLVEAIEDVLHQEAFLQTEWGKVYSIKGLGNRFSAWCDQAGLVHCSAHGVRKADAVIAAEQGASAHELLSMFGWKKLSTAELYTKKANEKKLGRSGSKKLLKK